MTRGADSSRSVPTGPPSAGEHCGAVRPVPRSRRGHPIRFVTVTSLPDNPNDTRYAPASPTSRATEGARVSTDVTVILPSRRLNHGPQISALSQVRVLEYPELSTPAFTDADVRSARAVAVVWQDDVGNLHAGLRAQELNPDLRLVLAIFNRRLGDHIRLLFPDCTVLSGTAMSARARCSCRSPSPRRAW